MRRAAANSRTNARTAKTPSVLNWRSRKAEAPSCTAAAMFFMLVGALAGREHLRSGTSAAMRQRDDRDDADDDDEGEVAAGQVHGRPCRRSRRQRCARTSVLLRVGAFAPPVAECTRAPVRPGGAGCWTGRDLPHARGVRESTHVPARVGTQSRGVALSATSATAADTRGTEAGVQADSRRRARTSTSRRGCRPALDGEVVDQPAESARHGSTPSTSLVGSSAHGHRRRRRRRRPRAGRRSRAGP